MNENNINGFNPEPTVPTQPVTPEVPVAPVAPTPVAPTETVVPSETVQPVQPVAPVQPTAPVMPEAPVMQTTVEPQAQGFNPIETPSVSTTPQAPKNNNTIFIVAVVVLVLVIGGLGAYLVFNNSGKKMDNNKPASTEVKGIEETTTNEINTSTRVVTTNPYTTTQPRTTRSVDAPTPTPTGSNTIQIYRYNVSLPGYESYEKDGVIVSVNKTQNVQLIFAPVTLSYEDYFSDENLQELDNSFYQNGFEVVDAQSGYVGNRAWGLILLNSANMPAGYQYVFMVTQLDANTTLEVLVLYNTSTAKLDDILKTVTTALDNKVQAFAPEEGKTAEPKQFDNFDKFDERLFN